MNFPFSTFDQTELGFFLVSLKCFDSPNVMNKVFSILILCWKIIKQVPTVWVVHSLFHAGNWAKGILLSNKKAVVIGLSSIHTLMRQCVPTLRCRIVNLMHSNQSLEFHEVQYFQDLVHITALPQYSGPS